MFFKTKNLSVYYEKYGENDKTILILPGWGETRKTFDFLIKELKNDYTIYILDYPGIGNSSTPIKDLTIYNYTEIIYSFLKKNKIKKPIIIAHSFGGRISSILISKLNFKVEKLILMDVAGIKRLSLKKIIKQKIYKLLKKLTTHYPKLQEKLAHLFGSKDYNNLPNSMKKTFQNIVNEDLRKYYKNINIETLIIWGEKDKDTPLKDAKYINKHIKNSGLIIYKNSNHFSYLNYPYLTINIIKEFLK